MTDSPEAKPNHDHSHTWLDIAIYFNSIIRKYLEINLSQPDNIQVIPALHAIQFSSLAIELSCWDVDKSLHPDKVKYLEGMKLFFENQLKIPPTDNPLYPHLDLYYLTISQTLSTLHPNDTYQIPPVAAD